MGSFGWPEILVIMLVVLLLFGARRIPEIAGALGKGIRDFKRSLSDTERAIAETPAPRTTDRLNRAEEGETIRQEEVRSEPKRLI